jgi:hypothetical protein
MAESIRRGESRILSHQIISDDGVEGSLDSYSSWMKPGRTSMIPFSLNDEQSSLQTVFVVNGLELKNRKWVAASPKLKKYIQEQYEWHLKRIADIIGIPK